jgi:hypothetical protein
MSNDPIALLDAAERRRSPATRPGYLAGRAPRNKGMRYPPEPPRPEEIILVMRHAGRDRHALRIRALIAISVARWAADLGGASAQRDRRRRTPRIVARASR